ncbi:MAG: DUF6338 family protein [Aquisalimonadaceae bacterium]
MNISVEALNILFLLMPGFISSRVLDAVITRKSSSISEKIIEALIFSFLIYAISSLVFNWAPLFIAETTQHAVIYTFSKDYWLISSVLFHSLALPLILGAIIHHDLHTALFRSLKVTDKTSRSSVWQDVYVSEKRHVVVHLNDGRRIYGWPMYFSHDPTDSFIYLFQPAWITKDQKYVEAGTHGILIKNEMILFVEFMKKHGEDLKALSKVKS